MNKVLSDLSQTCRKLLIENPGPEGRKLVATHLQHLLRDADAAETLVPVTAGDTKKINIDFKLR